jgi:tRNA/rRNA methyltransferase
VSNSCRIVLVRPEVEGNIGATARVMRNFGLKELVLVSPVANPGADEARSRAVNGVDVLDQARVVASLDDALVGCVAMAATSARQEGIIRGSSVGDAFSVIKHLRQRAVHGPVAMVFGPEPSGLTTDEVSRCDQLIAIPADPEYPVLNLSHAVGICAYEWFRQNQPVIEPSVDPPAPDEVREAMLQHFKCALEDVHFLWDEKAELLFHGFRRLIGRAQPTSNDVRLLHGIARQMEWVVRHEYKVDRPPYPRSEG